jgi:heme exporter protein A
MNAPARILSSGMKQRLKFAFALVHSPPILILDEPMSNLDSAGKQMVRGMMDAQIQKGVLIVATNDTGDVARVKDTVNLDG